MITMMTKMMKKKRLISQIKATSKEGDRQCKVETTLESDSRQELESNQGTKTGKERLHQNSSLE